MIDKKQIVENAKEGIKDKVEELSLEKKLYFA